MHPKATALFVELLTGALSPNINQADPVLTRKETAAVFLEVLPQEHCSYMKSFCAKLKSKTIHVTVPLDWEVDHPLPFTEAFSREHFHHFVLIAEFICSDSVSETSWLPVPTSPSFHPLLPKLD